MIEIAGLGPDDDAAGLARFAAPQQSRAERFQAYFGEDVDEIAAEIDDVPDWHDVTWVARSGDRLVGWVIAEHDDEIGRVWWWGPVVAEDVDWSDVAERLIDAAITGLDGRFDQFEFAVGADHSDAIELGSRLGYRRDVGSVALRLDPDRPRPVAPTPPGIRVIEPTGETGGAIADGVADLHDRIFPAGHLTGRQVAESVDDVVLAAVDGAEVVGYLRAEHQPGGDGYLDFVGVEPARRSAGIAGALVLAAIERLQERGATAITLTVREDNAAARALYARLGFDGDRALVPLRLGFST